MRHRRTRAPRLPYSYPSIQCCDQQAASDVWYLAPLNEIESKRAVSVLLYSFIIHFPSIPVVELLDLVGNQLLRYACSQTDRANHKHCTKYIDLVDKVRGAFSKLKARVGVGPQISPYQGRHLIKGCRQNCKIRVE